MKRWYKASFSESRGGLERWSRDDSPMATAAVARAASSRKDLTWAEGSIGRFVASWSASTMLRAVAVGSRTARRDVSIAAWILRLRRAFLEDMIADAGKERTKIQEMKKK
jgi:hypothetical protein